MFRKKDGLEEYYKERKMKKIGNKHEIELERKVLGKKNKKTGEKILGIIIGGTGIIFILCILIKQPFIMSIINSKILTVMCILIFPVLISAWVLEYDGETDEMPGLVFKFDFSEEDELKDKKNR